jgi:ribose 5-phosphate isomerase A
LDWIETAKKTAAIEAARQVKNNNVIGLGSGSTVAYAIGEIGRRIKDEELKILGIPTSYQAFLLALSNQIELTTLNEHPRPDLAIDGADQIDKELNAIKGMGGALTREKIVATSSKHVILIVDETKVVEKLGVNQPIPIEVLPYALSTVLEKTREIVDKASLREAKSKVGPTITDNGNFIIDLFIERIEEPRKLNRELKEIPGVIETGIFTEIVDEAYIGTEKSIEKLNRKNLSRIGG